MSIEQVLKLNLLKEQIGALKLLEHEIEKTKKIEKIEKRKQITVKMIDVFLAYLTLGKADEGEIILPQFELFILSSLTESLLLLRNEMGIGSYHSFYGEVILKLELHIKQRAFFIYDWHRCQQLKLEARKLIVNAQADPLDFIIDLEMVKKYQNELNGIQRKIEQHLEQGPVKNIFFLSLNTFREKNQQDSDSPAVPKQESSIVKNTLALSDGMFKNMYAINRVLDYLKPAASVSLQKGDELSISVIERALQVAGEYFKNTENSPHISSELEEKFKSLGIPCEKISKARDALSHSGPFIFSVREKFKQDKIGLAEGIQKDLKKMIPPLLKLSYVQELEQVKSMIDLLVFDGIDVNSNAIVHSIKQTKSLPSLEQIENELSELLKNINDSTDPILIANQPWIEDIILNCQLKKTRLKISYLELLNLNNPSLSKKMYEMDKAYRSNIAGYSAFLLNNRVIPRDKSISAISEMEEIQQMPLSSKEIKLFGINYSAEMWRHLLIKSMLKEYLPLYEDVKQEAKQNLNVNNVLLDENIDFVIRSKNNYRELLDVERESELLNLKAKFSLISRLLWNKDRFKKLLLLFDKQMLDKSAIQQFVRENEFNETDKKILSDSLLQFKHNVWLEQLVHDYFDGFIDKAKKGLKESGIEKLDSAIKAKKRLYQVKSELLAACEGAYTITDEVYLEYIQFIEDSVKKNAKNSVEAFKAVFSQINREELKRYLATHLNDNYGVLFNAIQKKDWSPEVIKSFNHFIGSLNLDRSLSDHLKAAAKSHITEEYKNIFLDKKAALERINNNSPLLTPELTSANEMLLLDLITLYKNLNKIDGEFSRSADPEIALLKNIPLKEGFVLRNYLAHGDPLFDAVQPDFVKKLTDNIRLMLEGQPVLEQEAMLNSGTDEGATNKIEDRISDLFDSELREAVAHGNLKKINYLFSIGLSNFKTQDESGWNLAFFAVETQNPAVLEWLIEKDIAFDQMDMKSGLPIQYLILQGDEKMLPLWLDKLLVNNPSLLNKSNAQGFNLLHFSAIRGLEFAVTDLLRRNLVAKVVAAQDWTPLLLAVAFGHETVVTKFIAHLKQLGQFNAEQDLVCPDSGRTALNIATWFGHEHLVKRLLNEGQDAINQRNFHGAGFAPLHHAVVRDNFDLVHLLCAKGADVNVQSGNEEHKVSPLHLAVIRKNPEMVGFFLQQTGLKVDQQDAEANTALHYAALFGFSRLIEPLVLKEATLKAQNKMGFIPFHYAIRGGAAGIVNLFIEKDSSLLQYRVPLKLYGGFADDLYRRPFTENKMNRLYEAKIEFTGLDVAIARGQFEIVQLLRQQGGVAYNEDLVLHEAILGGNPEVILWVLAELKEKFPQDYQLKIDSRDIAGETPLMWAASLHNPSVIEILLNEQADATLKNSKGQTALDLLADNEPVELVEDKSAFGSEATTQPEQKAFELLYARIYGQGEDAPSIDFNQLWSDLLQIRNEALETYLYKSRVVNGQLTDSYDQIQQKGLTIVLAEIKNDFEKAITTHYPHYTENLQQILSRLIFGMSLKPDFSNELAIRETMQAFTSIRDQATVMPHSEPGCSKRQYHRKRRENAACLEVVEEKEVIYDPAQVVDEIEAHAMTVLVAATQTPAQRRQLIQTFAGLHSIKVEKYSHQSQNEREKLRLWAKTLAPLQIKDRQSLQQVSAMQQAQLIRLSDQSGQSFDLAIHATEIANRAYFSIYCPKFNGYRALLFKQKLPLETIVGWYANFLFPPKISRVLTYQYYVPNPVLLPILSGITAKLTALDFRSDTALLVEHGQRIEGLTITQFRDLFLINGKIPEIAQCHADIFNDARFKFTFRSEKIAQFLWIATKEEQLVLGRLLNKYAIPSVLIKTSVAEPFEQSLHQFNVQLIEQLKTNTQENKFISQDTLADRTEQFLKKELLAENFSHQEVGVMLKKINDFQQQLGSRVAKATAMTRQGIFLAPAIIQAINGDTSALSTLLVMMGSDMSIDQLYQAFLSHPAFRVRFPKAASALTKSARYVASPIGKILLFDSFITLIQQKLHSQPGSPEHQLADNLLKDNTLILGGLLVEFFGLELGPFGIILDLGITIDQLLAVAQYCRASLPIHVSVWESIRLSLGFDKVWLEEQLMENSLSDRYVKRTEQLTEIISTPFSSVLIRAPRLVEMRIEADWASLQRRIQDEIAKNPSRSIETNTFKYIAPQRAIHPPIAKLPARYLLKQYRVETYQTIAVFLEKMDLVLYQENTIFPREKTHGNWTIVASNVIYSSGDEGEKIFGSPIRMVGDTAALMKHPQDESGQEKRLLIHFNPIFGAMQVRGGNFLNATELTIAIETLSNGFLLAPQSARQASTSLTITGTNRFINKINYVVGANDHPSVIHDDDDLDIELLILPRRASFGLHSYPSPLSNVHFSSEQSGTVCLGAPLGPCFSGLNKKNFIIHFNDDYILSGNVSLDTPHMQLTQVRSSFNEPVHFVLKREQSVEISLLAGRSLYSVDNQQILQCQVTRMAHAPKVSKLPQQSHFALYIAQSQPLNGLSIDSDGINIRLPADVMTIRKLDANTLLTIHGFYQFSYASGMPVHITLNQQIKHLSIICAVHINLLLNDRNFFYIIKEQDFDIVVLHLMHSKNRVSINFKEQAPFINIDYQGIRYRFDEEQGLVAIRGCMSADNPLREDFSQSLSRVIDIRDHANLPQRLNKTSLQVDKRKFINLKPSMTLLTNKGAIPMELLLFRSRRDTSQARLPTFLAKEQPARKILASSAHFLLNNSSPSHSFSMHEPLSPYRLPFFGEPKKEMKAISQQPWDGNGLLQLGIWFQGMLKNKKTKSSQAHLTSPLFDPRIEKLKLAEETFNQSMHKIGGKHMN